MPDWPAPTRVDDRRFANALREGDATDVAHVYSGYAAPLFDYCHALLRDQDDAAAALHDTFVAAHTHIGRLTEPEYFRAWLYALARNEALGRLNDPARPVERHEAPEVDNAFQDAEERSRRVEGRALMHSALSALSGRQRETIDLMLRHGLEAQDLAGIFGLSGEQATELAADTRKRLDEALAAAVVARTGAEACPSVGALMEHGGWPLTPAVSRKLIRHIQNCPACGERNQRKVSAARLIETLPVALLPAGLQRTVLTTLTSPDAAATRAEIAAAAEPLDTWGWPTPFAGSGSGSAAGKTATRSRTAALWPLAAAGALMIVLAGSMLLWLPASSDRNPPRSDPSVGAAPLDVSETPEAAPSDEPTPTPEVSETPEASETPSPTPSASTTPTPSPTPTKSPVPPPIPPPPAPPGRLSVDPGTCTGLSVPSGESVGCVLTVRAVGGKVSWSVTGTSGGSVSASGGGTLAKGASTTVPVSVSDTCTGNTVGGGAVNFSPNGTGLVTWSCVAPQETVAADPPATGAAAPPTGAESRRASESPSL